MANSTHYYAHTTDSRDKQTWQPLKDHLVNVAELASGFASDFNGQQFAYASGMLHDLGKYSIEFQRLLEGARIRVDHSTAGALVSRGAYPAWQSRLLEYIVAGHHGGLMDYGSTEEGLESRLVNRVVPDYMNYIREVSIPDLKAARPIIRTENDSVGFSISFFIRMLYSCLVDADSLDTEKFCDLDRFNARGKCDTMEALGERFQHYMEQKRTSSESSEINHYRNEIFDRCVQMGSEQPGMFSLTVPTGGGKTLSSMAFALGHVKANHLKRIIYVIPFTSIIEQTAAIFKEIFGKNNVLEHHSNFDPLTAEDESEDSDLKSLRLSTDNWDAPIIVTTNVQFFESLFSNRRSRCRKIHNLSKSTIIFDEAQMLPTNYLLPCLASISELVRNYNCSAVLCTATQPKLGDLLGAKNRPKEIMSSPEQLYHAFKRVVLRDLGEVDDIDLMNMLRNESKVLCIVNTRNHATALYDALSDLDNTFHLSARMCAVHRREVLKTIKDVLKVGGQECRVISTQIVEAGVDIDFPKVYRAISGLDSIIQAAGRCNREGKLHHGDLCIFRSTEIHGQATSWQRRTAEIGEMVLRGQGDPLSLDNIAAYFQSLYFHEGTEGLDSKKILGSLEERGRECKFPFEEISGSFNLIEKRSRDVVIPYDRNAVSIIDDMKRSHQPWMYLRRLQGYTVSVYDDEFNKLVSSHMVDNHDDRFFILNDMSAYSSKKGLLNDKYNGKEMPLLMI